MKSVTENMKCHCCGANLKKRITNLPFKTGSDSIVILKSLPVLECENCHEFLIEDQTMEEVEQILNKSDKSAELEVLQYAS